VARHSEYVLNGHPWLISETGLQEILAIWSRGAVFQDALEAARKRNPGSQKASDDGDEDDLPSYRNEQKREIRDGVAVIGVTGPLFRHANMLTNCSGARTYQGLRKDIQAALDDPTVKAVLLNVDSPGGEATGCHELCEWIRTACERKPIRSYVGGNGASAAYWIVSSTQMITVAPTGFVGSIGVRMALIDDSKAQDESGFKRVEIISSQSPRKRSQPVDDELMGRLQTRADYLAEVFVRSVAAMRSAKPETVIQEWGAGDVLIASKAVAAGSADAIGSLEDAITGLSKAVGDQTTMAEQNGISALLGKAISDVTGGLSGDQAVPALYNLQAQAQSVQTLQGRLDQSAQTISGLEAEIRAALITEGLSTRQNLTPAMCQDTRYQSGNVVVKSWANTIPLEALRLHVRGDESRKIPPAPAMGNLQPQSQPAPQSQPTVNPPVMRNPSAAATNPQTVQMIAQVFGSTPDQVLQNHASRKGN